MSEIHAERRGDWMQTYTGRKFWPLDPRPSEVFAQDIARALSMRCRYSGMTTRFYSVAEHSVLVSYAVARDHAREALLHDATEAYIGDMIRPLKRFMPSFVEAESQLERVIFERFCIVQTSESHADVKDADDRILIDEHQVRSPDVDGWSTRNDLKPLNVFIEGWSPREAERAWQERFVYLFPEYRQ